MKNEYTFSCTSGDEYDYLRLEHGTVGEVMLSFHGNGDIHLDNEDIERLIQSLKAMQKDIKRVKK